MSEEWKTSQRERIRAMLTHVNPHHEIPPDVYQQILKIPNLVSAFCSGINKIKVVCTQPMDKIDQDKIKALLQFNGEIVFELSQPSIDFHSSSQNEDSRGVIVDALLLQPLIGFDQFLIIDVKLSPGALHQKRLQVTIRQVEACVSPSDDDVARSVVESLRQAGVDFYQSKIDIFWEPSHTTTILQV